jgi:sterol desaturase/sphingolipid hydroxylase (fatty acid hydroxylase superfamily)
MKGEPSVSLETASFFLLVLACSLWEWRQPGWRIDRRADLGLNLVSFVIAVASALASREIITAAIGRCGWTELKAALHCLHDMPFAGKLIFGLLAIDFTIYWIHRAQHRFAVAWRTHRWHHSAEQMYWLAGFRTSFLHSLVYNIPQTIVPIHLLGLTAIQAGIGYSIGLFVQFWNHANARARIGWLKFVFIRPQDHRVHHAALRLGAANFAFIFSIWDRCFGTYVDGDAQPPDYPLGLGERIDPRTLPRMFLGA